MNLKYAFLTTSSAAAAVLLAAQAEARTIISNESVTDTQDLEGSDTLVIESGADISVHGNAIRWNGPATDLLIDNSGIVQSIEVGGRAIDAGGAVTDPRNLTLINRAGGIIRSENDAIRFNTDLTGGRLVIENYGTIQTTNGGQAIDFDAINSPATDATSVEINNYSGGVIRSFGADAVRPGEDGFVTNAGLIMSEGLPGASNDAVDMQEHTGFVRNLTGGLISGQRHGITTDVHVYVYNEEGATILGRNGSGVGSDGTAKVVNYGTIRGEYDGSQFGDGDGVDIDFYGELDNYGLIEGTGGTPTKADGRFNTPEGVVMTGGGYINNHAGGVIRGAGSGITGANGLVITNNGLIEGPYALSLDGNVDVYNGPDGIISSPTARGVSSIYGNINLVNEGIIDAGYAVALNTPGSNTVTNSGTIRSRYYAIYFGDGDDLLTIKAGSEIFGIVEGGAGHDRIILENGAIFDRATGFEAMQINGFATITGANSVDQTTITSLGGLTVEGTLLGTINVSSGGRIGGSGTVGSLSIQSGGMLAPGDTATVLTTLGDVVLAQDAIFVVQVDSDDNASMVAVGGDFTIQGANVTIEGLTPANVLSARYLIADVTGQVVGDFGSSTTGFPFLSPLLERDGTNLYLQMARNQVPFRSFANTYNQISAADALDSLGNDSSLKNLLLIRGSEGLPFVFDQLSGELHSSVSAVLLEDARLPLEHVRARLLQPAKEGTTLWMSGVTGGGSIDGGEENARITRDTTGISGGLEIGFADQWRAGGGFSYTDNHARVVDLGSMAKIKATTAMVYLAKESGKLRLRAGASHGWGRISTNRSVRFDNVSNDLRARYKGSISSGFAEVGIAAPVGNTTLEPFAGMLAERAETAAFAETSGIAAVAGKKMKQTQTAFRKGVRTSVPLSPSVSLHGVASWNRILSGKRTSALLRYVDGGDDFRIHSAPVSRSSVDLMVGTTWSISPTFDISAGYIGRRGANNRDNQATATMQLAF